MKKLSYQKGVAIIYNPTSGKKKNIKPLLERCLTKAKIKCEFFQTERRMHAFEIV